MPWGPLDIWSLLLLLFQVHSTLSRLSGTAGGKKSRNKRTEGKKSRPFTARASGEPSSVAGVVARDDDGETLFHGGPWTTYQLPLIY